MKYKLTQNSMRLRDVEVRCTFSGPNLAIDIGYRIPSNRCDLGIDANLGHGSEGETLVLLHQGTGKGTPGYGAFLKLYPETAQERKALSGPAIIREASYIGTNIHFCPRVTEKQYERTTLATKA